MAKAKALPCLSSPFPKAPIRMQGIGWHTTSLGYPYPVHPCSKMYRRVRGCAVQGMSLSLLRLDRLQWVQHLDAPAQVTPPSPYLAYFGVHFA